MTTTATYAVREASWNPSRYRGEQYASDLGLYYLRARYYNPLTGRFMSRDPEDGKAKDPRTLHKYLYADGDPIDAIDPRGQEAMFQTANLMAASARRTAKATFLYATGIGIGYACLYVELETLNAELEHVDNPFPVSWRVGCIAVDGVVPVWLTIVAIAAGTS